MGKRTRAKINNKTKLASTLARMFFTYEEAKMLSEDQILSLIVFDHDPVPHAEGGTDDFWNLTPSLIVPHREKTAKIDTPGIAKRKRVSKAHQEFVVRLLTPRSERPAKVSRWGSRPFQKREKRR